MIKNIRIKFNLQINDIISYKSLMSITTDSGMQYGQLITLNLNR